MNPSHTIKKKQRTFADYLYWIQIGLFCVIAFFIYETFGPPSRTVTGTDRPDWLPEAASDIYYQTSGKHIGWVRYAEFTISEGNFRKYANERGRGLIEKKGFSKVEISGAMPWRRPDEPAESDYKSILRVLRYERRASHNGGITVTLDTNNSRAYYSESDR